jgi:hypothetical protein
MPEGRGFTPTSVMNRNSGSRIVPHDVPLGDAMLR